MKFNDMVYERIDIEKTKAKLSDCISRFEKAESFAQAESVFLEVEKLSSKIDTMYSLAYVRHEINTEDEFYSAEADFMDEALPLLQESIQQWSIAQLKSQFRPQFEEKYGRLMFSNIEIQLKTFSSEIVPELQEENRLTTEYTKLLASAQIPFEGGVYTLSQLAPFKQDTDDGRRLRAWEADGLFYEKNGQRLDELYDRLTAVRDRMAKKLGYKDYIELGYYRMNRNSYDKDDVDKFRAAVRKHLVPVAEKIFRQQAERIGKACPMNFADAALSFRSGNPKPQGTPDDILAQGRKFYHELSAETAEFIDFMYRDELLDVLSRRGKAGGGFCISLPDYRAQFIFANFNGTAHDVEVITHEAGHAFAGYTCRDIVPMENRQPTLEACEVHSMSMEFFAWPWSEGFFGADTDKFLYSHLSGALTFIPYGAMVDHFQHEVYERPDMSPAQRHEVWKELLKVYMPWIKLGELPFYGDGRSWQRQMHIYERPFYYIDYCLAQTVALQFWALMQKDMNDAWSRYMNLVKLGGTRTFTELVAAAGLDTPFGDDALDTISKAAEKWLHCADLSSL